MTSSSEQPAPLAVAAILVERRSDGKWEALLREHGAISENCLTFQFRDGSARVFCFYVPHGLLVEDFEICPGITLYAKKDSALMQQAPDDLLWLSGDTPGPMPAWARRSRRWWEAIGLHREGVDWPIPGGPHDPLDIDRSNQST